MIMKTIEEKALAYDKALEKVRCLYKHLNNEGTVIYPFELENIFSELKEGKDERVRKGLIDYFSGPINHLIPNIANEEIRAWLEKQGMQKQILANSAKTCKIEPAEWSEEDEEELNKIIAHFDWTGNNRFTKDDCKWAQYWLKSLRPQSLWKPSDEQMKAFHIILRLAEGEIYRTALSLYDDLKKLVQWHEEK